MPYRRKGKTVYVKKGGRWRKKGTSKSVRTAKRYHRLLQGIKHGWRPTRGKRRKRKR